MSAVVWYLDRGAALIAYPSLYLAVLTGILYNTPSFGILHTAAQRVHIELSVFAMVLTLLHAAVGLVDSWMVVTGQVPEPAYSVTYFVIGVGVGFGALVLLVVAVLGFIDAQRFKQPWGPRVVHAFTYAGFAFGTIHAVAVGTDLLGLIKPIIVPSIAFLIYVLLVRLVVLRGFLPNSTAK